MPIYSLILIWFASSAKLSCIDSVDRNKSKTQLGMYNIISQVMFLELYKWVKQWVVYLSKCKFFINKTSICVHGVNQEFSVKIHWFLLPFSQWDRHGWLKNVIVDYKMIIQYLLIYFVKTMKRKFKFGKCLLTQLLNSVRWWRFEKRFLVACGFHWTGWEDANIGLYMISIFQGSSKGEAQGDSPLPIF